MSELLLLLLAVKRTRQSLLEALAAILLVWPALSILLLSACLPQQWLVKILSKRGTLLDQVNRWLA